MICLPYVSRGQRVSDAFSQAASSGSQCRVGRCGDIDFLSEGGGSCLGALVDSEPSLIVAVFECGHRCGRAGRYGRD